MGIKVIKIKAGRSLARNIGTEKAIGNLILSLDSDMKLTPTVIEECVEKIEENYDALIIPEVSVGEGFWAECKALEKSCYIGEDLLYDEELEAGEDCDINQRICKAGYRIGRINALIKRHEGRLGLRETILKKHHPGKTLGRYRLKHPQEAGRQLKLIIPAFIRN